MSDQPASVNQPPRKRPAWLGFVAGFGIVFLSMSLVWPMHFYDGQSLRQTSLWRYYLLEIQLAMNSSGALGPTSGNAFTALGVFATHILVSTIGGLACAGIGWAAKKRAKKA